MEQLSFKKYIAKCVLGGEVAYALCVVGGYLSLGRTPRATDLHHALFETLPGFVWGEFSSVLLGAFYMLIFSVVFGAYMVWMHNSSLINR